MATEDIAPAGNGEDVGQSETAPRKATSVRRARPRASVPREPVNTIRASRKHVPNQATKELVVTEGANAPSTTPAPAPADLPHRADTDPWTVPQSVRDRFVQDGHRFYFPDGAPAFRDLGRRLTTAGENTQVVHSLIEIAHARSWSEIAVTGTDRFRQEAWRQARLAGLAVRGYRPSDAEQAQLIRTLGRILTCSPERVDPVAAGVGTPAAHPSDMPARAGAVPAVEPREKLVGKLLDHGRDAYRHDPNEEPSYFVRLQTRDGTREVWGKDIERAIAKSLTQPQIGDEVVLQHTGRNAVTVKRQEQGADGQNRSREVDVFRNRWVIEKQSFFQARAAAVQIIRDETVGPREAVRQHPELAGTYLNLRAAELASKSLRDPEDQRRFVAQVRSALANTIERGEALQPVRLRERTPGGPVQPPREADREISR